MTAPIDRIENIKASVDDVERQMNAWREGGLDFPPSLTWRLLSECRSLLRQVQDKPACCSHTRCPGGSLCCCIDEAADAQTRAQAREVLDQVSDRMDEHAYSELSSALDDIPHRESAIGSLSAESAEQQLAVRADAQEALDQAYRFCHATKREPGQPPVARVIADLATAVRALLDAPSEMKFEALVDAAMSVDVEPFKTWRYRMTAALRTVLNDGGIS